MTAAQQHTRVMLPYHDDMTLFDGQRGWQTAATQDARVVQPYHEDITLSDGQRGWQTAAQQRSPTAIFSIGRFTAQLRLPQFFVNLTALSNGRCHMSR